MEIIQGSCSYLQLLQPSLHFQLPPLSPSRFSLSFAAKYKFQPFYTPLPTSPLSLTPNTPRNYARKPLTTTRSLLNEGSSDSATKVVEADPSLAVKKKAAEISAELKGTSIFLVGINNAVKTSLGKLLADSLRYYYFDSDSLVEEAAGGKPAAKRFRERDEKGFRDSETEVLKQLSSMGCLVVCAGNGAVQGVTNLALLRHGISIWIDVPLDMVAGEVVGDGIQHPESEISISGSYYEVLTQLTALYEEMRSGYATADATVSIQKVASQIGYDDLDAVTTEDMGLEVLKEIEKLTRVKQMMEEAARPF